MISRALDWLHKQRLRESIPPSIEYLLINELNSEYGKQDGAASSERLRALFLSFLRRVDPSIFCDVGAHDAQASLTVRCILPTCRIYAFEANPEIYSRNNASLKDKGFQYLNLAISDRSGSATVFVPRTLSKAYVDGNVVDTSVVEPQNTGKASLLKRNEDATYAEFAVQTISLDGFFRAQHLAIKNERFALWIDVEGAGANVLAGAKAVLRHTAIIFIETEGFEFWKDQIRSSEISQFLIRHGFIPIARDYEYGDKQFNVLFLSSEHLKSVYDDLFSASSDLKMFRRVQADFKLRNTGTSFDAHGSQKRTFPSVGSFLRSQIPIFIPTFNNLTYLRIMLDQLSRLGMPNIIIMDNCSDFPPFLSYLRSLEGQLTIIYEAENKGPRHVFEDVNSYRLLPEYFCLTDPDLEFSPDLPKDFLEQLIGLTEAHRVGKAGFSLDISEPEKMRQEDFMIGEKSYKIWDWEAQFWLNPLPSDLAGNPVYKATIDTTFAIYNKKFFKPENPLDAVRVAGAFTCRHLEWYRDTRFAPGEESHYRKTSKFSHYLRG